MDSQAVEILRQLTILSVRLHVRMDAIERLLDGMEARRKSQGASRRSAEDYKLKGDGRAASGVTKINDTRDLLSSYWVIYTDVQDGRHIEMSA